MSQPPMPLSPDALSDYLDAHPDTRSLRVAVCDLNAQARGKRMPIMGASKVAKGTVRMPYSVLNVDLWGADIEDSPLVFQTGDQDGVLHPTGRGPVPMPWLNAPAALIPTWMFDETGTPFDGDPRHALNAVLTRYAAHGLTPVVAMELEFFLIDDSGTQPKAPVSPRSGKRHSRVATLSLQALDAFDAFFNDLYAACEAMGIPADTATSEAARGQFEITFDHQADALKAADDAWLFRQLVKGLARQHGFAATFMAKPYDDAAGNGLHTHFSVVDKAGQNVFDNGGPEGTALLHHALAGCIDAMADSMLVFAPHQNSYDRLTPENHAPTGICWAYENRTAALRVPGGPNAARRIEHRLAGGDANPYLMLAVILGAALDGIERKAKPPAPITGNAYTQGLPQVPDDWIESTTRLEDSAALARILPQILIRNLVLTKRQEQRVMAELSPNAQFDAHLGAL